MQSNHKASKYLVLIISILFTPSLLADNQDNQIYKSLQLYLTSQKQTNHVSAIQASILIPQKNNKTEHNYALGTKYFNKIIPATRLMLLQLGSITKEYVNALLWQQINTGKLQPQANLISLFPKKFTSNKWPSSWSNITVLQLMNMTSGIESYNLTPGFKIGNNYSLDDLINIAANNQLKNGCQKNKGCFPAGSSWFYSNTNYIILGKILENITGHSITYLFDNKIIKPNQFTNQLYYEKDNYPKSILKRMIRGYSYLPSPLLKNHFIWVDTTNINMSWAATAGALTGNMQTLAILTNKLYNNKLLKNVSIVDLQKNLATVPNGNKVYDIASQCHLNTKALPIAGSCYANGIATAYSKKLGQFWWYSGGTQGYHTIYLYFPNENGLIITLGQNSGKLDDSAILVEALKINTIVRKYLS